MNKDKFLKTVCKQIHFGWDRDIVSRELEYHIEDSMLDLIDEGYSREEAERIAIEQMGDPIEIGKQLNEEHKPLLGWLWLISKLIVILFIFPTLIFLLSLGKDLQSYVWPIESASKENTIKINETFDFDAHIVTIDKIIKKNDLYCITYHAMAKLNVNRTGVVDYLFYITDENGNKPAYDGEFRSFKNTIIGCQGEYWFDIPKDNIIYISFTNGETVILDLEEYQYE